MKSVQKTTRQRATERLSAAELAAQEDADSSLRGPASVREVTGPTGFVVNLKALLTRGKVLGDEPRDWVSALRRRSGTA